MAGGIGIHPAQERLAPGGWVHTRLVFSKRGAEIQGQISKQIAKFQNDIEENRKQITQICKNRDLDANEVLNADDEEKIQAYTGKAYDNAPGKQSAVLKALENDLNQLRVLGWGITHATNQIEQFNRISAHIEPDRRFDLDYNELVSFGF